MGLAAGGQPDRFLTLTVNPAVGVDPDDRRRMLAAAFNHLWKRVRRRWPTKSWEYFVVVEKTKAGEPHLHVLVRGPYIPQAFISKAMKELIGAFIVDIRSLKNSKAVVNYVAKYLGKAPAKFANYKRYWTSENYDLREDDGAHLGDDGGNAWALDRRSIREISMQWTYEGYQGKSDGPDSEIYVYVGFRGPPEWSG